MDLVGAWLRQLLRAGTAAAIVPVALVAALLVVALGSGGFGGLGSLGELVAGPSVPELDTAGSSAAEDARVARVAPGGSDRASVRPSASAPRAGGGGAAATAPSLQARPGTRRPIAPAPGSSRVTAPPLEVVTPPVAPREPPPTPVTPPAQPQAPPLADVLSATVNGVVAVVQTLLDQLGQTLGLTPRR